MENMNNEIIETTEEMDIVELYDVTDEAGESSGGVSKLALGVGIGLLVTVAAVAIKKKDDIKAWNTKRKIAKLEKQGYVVVTPEEMEAAEEEFVEGEVIIEAEETEE